MSSMNTLGCWAAVHLDENAFRICAEPSNNKARSAKYKQHIRGRRDPLQRNTNKETRPKPTRAGKACMGHRQEH